MNISQVLTKLKALIYSKSETDSLLGGKANSSHTHTKSQITDFPTIPSKVSQLTNDSGFITGVSWDNVSGKPSTFTPSSHTHTKNQITDFPSLATVATSGSYTDLSNKPTVPSNTNQLTNGAGYITSSGSCNYANSAGYVQGNNNSANAANALLRSGDGRNDSSPEGDTWIFLDELGGASAPWGFKHNQLVNTIGFYGAGTETSSINLSNGYFSGTVDWSHVVNRPTNVSSFTNDSGYITSSGSCSYSTTSGTSTYSTYLTSLGAQTPKSGRDIFHQGVYTYTTYTDTNTPAHYGAVIGYGNGQGGSCEMFAEWVGRGKLWFRVLRDCEDSWTDWQQIITSDNIGSQSVNYANSAGSAGSVAWNNVSGRPWAVSQFTNDSGFITSSGSCNYANSAGYTNWLRTSSHADHILHTEWDGSYFWTYVTAGDGGYRAVRVERSNSAGWADSAGGVAWGNVSGRPWALSQFTNDSGFITSTVASLELKNGNPYIDFHAGNSSQDYTSRIIDDGNNAGKLRLVAYYNSANYQVELYKNYFEPTVDNDIYLGDSTNRWKNIFCTTDSISTSDLRLKNTITDIDDSLLDAWENIEPKQYKFNDATEEKGDKARYHTGYLAQDIQAECEKQGVNASDYGLFCYDEWDEQEEVSEEIEKEKDGKIVKEKRIIQPKREKGDRYSLRYTEALVVECKYLRRENSRLKENLASIEERLEKLEKAENS